MTHAEIENHREVSYTLLWQAVEEFEANDLLQASEKAWGAVAHYLKAEAKFRRWNNGSHADLKAIAEDIGYETDDSARTQDLFSYVERMHRNFYECAFSPSQVILGINNARELIDRLERRTKPQLEPRPSQVRRRRLRRLDTS